LKEDTKSLRRRERIFKKGPQIKREEPTKENTEKSRPSGSFWRITKGVGWAIKGKSFDNVRKFLLRQNGGQSKRKRGGGGNCSDTGGRGGGVIINGKYCKVKGEENPARPARVLRPFKN